MSQTGEQSAVIKQAIKEKAYTCSDCPLQRGISVCFPQGSFPRKKNVGAAKVRTTCGACNDNEVRAVSDGPYLNCKRYIHANRTVTSKAV